MNEHAQAKTIDFLNHQYIFSFQDYFFYQTLYKDDSQLCYNRMIRYTIFLSAKCV